MNPMASKIPKRSGTAQAALGRRAPTMAHRNEPRGGDRNTLAELAEEYADGERLILRITVTRIDTDNLVWGKIPKHPGERLLGTFEDLGHQPAVGDVLKIGLGSDDPFP